MQLVASISERYGIQLPYLKLRNSSYQVQLIVHRHDFGAGTAI